MFRQNSDSMELEMSEMRNHIELFKVHISSIKDAFGPNNAGGGSCDREIEDT